MRVGWLHDNPGYLGGAELTMAEFKAAAPEGVTVVDPRVEDTVYVETAVVGNCTSFGPDLIDKLRGKKVIRYHHDLARHENAELREWLERNATHIFTSPLHQKRYGLDGVWPNIPPALDLDHFRRYANQNHRAGAVCVGRMAYGKGLELLAEYPEPVDVYSSVPIVSEGNARYRGSTADVAQTLSRYQRFVFLPAAIEPFGRSVVEAWAAGLDLVINRNVGARYWIEENPEGLETAAADFWRVVLG